MSETKQVGLDEALTIAVNLHRDGRLEDAESVYRAILAAVPDEPDACHNLGLLLGATARHDEGEAMLRRAVDLRPDIEEFWEGHINALVDAGRLADARERLSQSAASVFGKSKAFKAFSFRLDELSVVGDDPPADIRESLIAHMRGGEHAALVERSAALFNDFPRSAFLQKALAAGYRGAGNRDAAIDALSKAIALSPGDAEAHSNLGAVLLESNHVEAAERSLRKALTLDAKNMAGRLNLAVLLYELRRLKESESECRIALMASPESPDALALLAKILWQTNRIESAMPILEKALEVSSTSLPLLLSAASMHLARNQQQLAFSYAERATRLYPVNVAAWIGLGDVYGAAKMADDAIQAYRHALALDLHAAGAKFGLACNLSSVGQHDEAERLILEVADDPRFSLRALSNVLMWRNMGLRGRPEENLVLARRWSDACQRVQVAGLPVDQRSKRAGRRLRIGYVSGDFRAHAVAHFILDILKNHDAGLFEVYGYYSGSVADETTEQIRGVCAEFRLIEHLSVEEAIVQIRNDRLDVLVDLSGHTARNRLSVMMQRVAPVQVHYLGYFATTGVPTMDYWIGDAVLVPPEHDTHFSERVYRLGRPWIMYRPTQEAPEPAHRDASRPLTFGSYNRANKLGDSTFDLWSKVMHRFPQARLLLKANDMRSEATRTRILSAFAERGVASDRIDIEASTSTPTWQDHMASYSRIDVALDPVGAQGGGTTTCDALWMGVPVVCLLGDRMASRMSASLLVGAGLGEWVAENEEDYIDKVSRLALDAEQRASLRRSLRSTLQASPLCDPRGMTRALEKAYLAMFDTWCASQLIRRGRRS